MTERISKILSAAGVSSRREAEKLISAGLVTVNGKKAELGQKASADDDIRIRNQPVIKEPERVYIMLNKPRGYITSAKDNRGRRTIYDLLAEITERVYPVGRLDYDSEGLLLLTNDGELTQKLTHPKYGITKLYEVSVRGDIKTALTLLGGEITLDDGSVVKALSVVQASQNKLRIAIGEGRNRQVRRMCAAAGLEVTRLKRVAEGDLPLGGLKPGQWRCLTPHEVKILKRQDRHKSE